jgi:hypothetical protein
MGESQKRFQLVSEQGEHNEEQTEEIGKQVVFTLADI